MASFKLSTLRLNPLDYRLKALIAALIDSSLLSLLDLLPLLLLDFLSSGCNIQHLSIIWPSFLQFLQISLFLEALLAIKSSLVENLDSSLIISAISFGIFISGAPSALLSLVLLNFNLLAISLYFRELNESKELNNPLNKRIAIKGSGKACLKSFKYKAEDCI
jgi:hypothetical protein